MKFDIHGFIGVLRRECKNWQAPVITYIAQRGGSPFEILVSTILSLRTKDEVTNAADKRLFSKVFTPSEMVGLGEEAISKLIYPVGFYRNKAKNIVEISKILIDKYGGNVPATMEQLLELPGVGRKTANLVLSEGFNIPALCVDVHVHRISNRIGFVETKNPEETEFKLMEVLPKEFWGEYNTLLVAFGQTICKPVSPFCSKCPATKFCEKIGVHKSR